MVVAAVVVSAVLPVDSLWLRWLRSPGISTRSLLVFGRVFGQIYEARLLPYKRAVAPG